MIYFFIIITIALSLSEIFFYRQGIKDGYKLYSKEPIKEEANEISSYNPSIDEIARVNIENYQGDEVGQLDYEV